MSQTPFDMAYIMMNYFQQTHVKNKSALGFGMALTYIFEDLDIPLDDITEGMKVATIYNKLNERHFN